MDIIIGSGSNRNFIDNYLKKINGISFYKNFFSIKELEYTIDYINKIDLEKKGSKLVKRFGINISEKVKFINENSIPFLINKCPSNLHVLKELSKHLNIQFNQISIEQYTNISKIPIHSDIYSNVIIYVFIKDSYLKIDGIKCLFKIGDLIIYDRYLCTSDIKVMKDTKWLVYKKINIGSD